MCPVWIPAHLPPSYQTVMCYCPPVEDDWRERVRLHRNNLGNPTIEAADATICEEQWGSSVDLLLPKLDGGGRVSSAANNTELIRRSKHFYSSPSQPVEFAAAPQSLPKNETIGNVSARLADGAEINHYKYREQDVQIKYGDTPAGLNTQFGEEPSRLVSRLTTEVNSGKWTSKLDQRRAELRQQKLILSTVDVNSGKPTTKLDQRLADPGQRKNSTSTTEVNSGISTNKLEQRIAELKEQKINTSMGDKISGKSTNKHNHSMANLKQQKLTTMIGSSCNEKILADENVPKRKRKKNSCQSPKSKKSTPRNSEMSAENRPSGVSCTSRIERVSSMNEYEKSHVLHHLRQAGEVAMTILYENGTSLLRLPTDKLDGFTSEVRGCVVSFSISILCSGCDSRNDKKMDLVFTLFSLHKENSDYLWTRNVLGDLMASSTRKICFNGQKLVQTLTESLEINHKTVCKNWQVLDLRVAGWLLNPDHPPKSFSSLIQCIDLEMFDFQDSEYRVCEDVSILGPAMQIIYHSLKNQNLWHLFLGVETALCPVLALWELRGLNVNIEVLMHNCDMLKRKLDQLQSDAHKAAGEPFVINSHSQLRHILFEKLQLDALLDNKTKIAKTASGNQKSTSEAVLNQLQSVHPLPRIVLEYRQIQKLKSTYIDGMMNHVRDGCICTHWDQTSAATGRLASTHPNIQSIPKQGVFLSDVSDNSFIVGKESPKVEINARDAFVSRLGWSLLAADFQQMEFRLFAHLANDESLIRLFNTPVGHDIFTVLTSEWLEKSCQEITPTERDETKRIVYSVMYGVGKERLSEYLKINASAAKGVMDSFLVKFPGVNRFTNDCKLEARQKGFLSTIFNRRRWFPNINHANFQLRSQAERQAVNFRIQGSAADLCKAAMIQIEHALASKPHIQTRMLVQIHDELLLEVPDHEVEEVKDVVRSIMEDSVGLCGGMLKLRVPLRVSLKVGKSWGKMENTS